MNTTYLDQGIRMDLASASATAARQARIAAAREQAVIRSNSIEAAQRVYSKHKLRGKEVLTALQNIEANIDLSQDQWIRDRLTELCCDVEDSLAPPPLPPELPKYGSERGQFDSQTEGVLHRG